MAEFAELAREATAVLLARLGKGFYAGDQYRHDPLPWDINNGWCEDWAEELIRLFHARHLSYDEAAGDYRHPGGLACPQARWYSREITDEDGTYRADHCVAEFQGRFYDAEAPDGTDDVWDLPFWEQEERPGYDGISLPAHAGRPVKGPLLSPVQVRCMWKLLEDWRGYITLADVRGLDGNARTVRALERAGLAELLPGDRLALVLRPLVLGVLLPADGAQPSCGLLTELPRKQRRHRWCYLGLDFGNKGEQGIRETEVWACLRCGKDKR